MKLKAPLITGSVFLLGAAAFWLVSTSRAATETPTYRVIRTDGKFELRAYPALTVATTAMQGAGMNGGFGTLFRYLTGRNARAEKIAMTAPVLIDSTEHGKTMSFILPKKGVEQGVPQPTGTDVTIGHLPAAHWAVLRFSGGRTAKNEQTALKTLRAWLAAQPLAPHGAPTFAYYDPPWTPLFLRRNEVLLQIDPHE